MRIGVDLDGVVYDSETFLKAEAELLDLEIGGKGLVNPGEWSVSKRHNWPEEVYTTLQKRVRLKAIDNSPVMPLAKKVLDMLSKEGHLLYAITTRGEFVFEEIKHTKKALRRDKIKFDKMIFTQSGKLGPCQENKIDIMIDDRPKTIKELSKNGVLCFYFRAAELPKINNENVITVYNWGQIYRHIKNLNK